MILHTFLLIFLLALLYPISTDAQEVIDKDTCQYFYDQLREIPHTKLVQNSVIEESVLYGEKKKGCEVEFVTNDSLSIDHDLPDFIFSFQTSELYDEGWRYNENYVADGPGTSLLGIQKEDTLCLISYAQPASLMEPEKIVTEKNITIEVQCSTQKIGSE